MAKFDREDVHHLASLCRIKCTPQEEEDILHDLEKVLKYMEQLQGIDTSDVEPLSYVVQSSHDTMRDDVIESQLSRDEYLANAPLHVGGMIRVPPVLK